MPMIATASSSSGTMSTVVEHMVVMFSPVTSAVPMPKYTMGPAATARPGATSWMNSRARIASPARVVASVAMRMPARVRESGGDDQTGPAGGPRVGGDGEGAHDSTASSRRPASALRRVLVHPRRPVAMRAKARTTQM